MIDLDLFSDSSKDVSIMPWQPILGKICKMTFIRNSAYAVPKQCNGSSDLKIFNDNIVATSCANLTNISLVTLEITRVTTVPFWMRWKK